VGACCTGDEDGTCTNDVTQRDCNGIAPECNPSSHYIGKNCTQVSCPPAKYPCCYDNGTQITCAQKTLTECAQLGGGRSGECDESCNGNTCSGFGACCLPNGTCYAEFSNLCAIANGTHYPGQSCNQITCVQPPPPTGSACCIVISQPGCSGSPPINITLCESDLTVEECNARYAIETIQVQCDTNNDGQVDQTFDLTKTTYPTYSDLGSCSGSACDFCYTLGAGAYGADCLKGCCDEFDNLNCLHPLDCQLPSIVRANCTDGCGTGGPSTLIEDTSPTCSFCCGCVDGRVRDCCYEKDTDGRFVCDEQINSVQYKGVCEANTAHGKFCDSSQQIPVCAWIENNQLNLSNHRCTTLTDCEGTYNGTTNT
jgi:hypothetical protein